MKTCVGKGCSLTDVILRMQYYSCARRPIVNNPRIVATTNCHTTMNERGVILIIKGVFWAELSLVES